MQLPTDQYVLIPLPNNAKLEKKSEDLFTLLVPELQLFNVWLRPHVVSKVKVTPDGVLIEAVECRLDGSPEVQRLDLNSKFELSVKVVLQGIQGLCASICVLLFMRFTALVWACNTAQVCGVGCTCRLVCKANRRSGASNHAGLGLFRSAWAAQRNDSSIRNHRLG